jgi:hypothetical protein
MKTLGIWIGCALTLAAAQSPKGEVRMDLFTPEQLARGHANEVTVRIEKKALLQAAEVTPGDGISVSEIKVLDEKATDGTKRWSLVFTVDERAEPGKRSVVLVTSEGRTAARTVEIPPHVPELSGFSVSKTQRKPLLVDYSLSVFDVEDDLGDSPSLTYTLRCGGSILIGIGGGAKAVSTGPRTKRIEMSISQPGSEVLKPTICDLKVEISDTKGYTGRLKTTVEFK